MENTPEGNSGRRNKWPDQKNSERIAGAGRVKRKFLSDRVAPKNKSEFSERTPIKALPVEETLELPKMPVPDPKRLFSEMPTEQIVEMVTPASAEQYYEMWKRFNNLENMTDKSEKKFKSEFDKWIAKPENAVDFSDKTVARVKEIFKKVIDESPKFVSAIQKFGFPIIVAKTENAEKEIVKQMSGAKDEEARENSEVAIVSDAFTTSIAILPSAIKSLYPDGEMLEESSLISRASMPKMGEPLIDSSVNGQVRHEWSHYLISSTLNNSERLSATSRMKDRNNARLFGIAEKYMSDSTMMPLLDKEFSETKTMPRTITRYAHSNMFEMFAEGINAYLHPDTNFERFVINSVLRKDIQSALGEDE